MQEDYEELEKNYKAVKKKVKDYPILVPVDEKEARERFKNLDEATVNAIIAYIDLDSYKLVEQIARTVNSDNAATVIAHMDGGIARNSALKEMLMKYSKKTGVTVNRATGEMMTSKSDL